MKKRRIFWILVSLLLLIVGGAVICDGIVTVNARGKLYDDVESIPYRKVGLILGTSPVSYWDKKRNYYFDYRVGAGADLYKHGKVDWLVVSGGDYRSDGYGYDEPVAMRDSLIKLGVDSTRIILDYDGTRTLNSIMKMRHAYCQDSITIISQKFHNERAVYQAEYVGIDAIAFNAVTPGRRTSWWRNRSREILARVKMFVDVIRGSNLEFRREDEIFE